MIHKIVLGIAFVLLFQTMIQAQPQPPTGSPANAPVFSPYLNLLRPSGSLALNYFGIVQPQQQLQQQFNQIQQQNQQFGQQLNTIQSYNQQVQQSLFLPLTGHAATFNNTGHYFNSNPALGGAGGGLGRGVGGFAAPINRNNLLGVGSGFGATGFTGMRPTTNFGTNRPMNNFGANRPLNNGVPGGRR